MRKNKVDRKDLNVYSVFSVKGYNVNALINKCKREGVTLYNVRKKDEKTTQIAVKYSQTEKFFAITKELCYNNKNVKKIGEKGKLYPLLSLKRNIGLLIGGLLLSAIIIFSDDFLFSVEYTGSGVAVKDQIEAYLNGRGITRFTRFSSLDLPRLEDEILADNDRLSFVGCQKRGNRLIIELALAQNPQRQFCEIKDKLISCVNGRVADIKVYRGRAAVSVGDVVKTGDVLADGTVTVKDSTVNVGVIAYAEIDYDVYAEYRSDKDGEEDRAEIFALQNINQDEPVCVKTEKIFTGVEYVYKTTVTLRRVLYA